MADKFRVALSRDFLTAEGEPLFPMFDRTPLDEDPDIEWHYLENANGPVDAGELAGHDALILLAQRFDRSSVPGDGRLAMVARFGVGYDSVDVPACSDNGIALVITPNGVRRPVAVAIIALILAVMGKLLLKDQLTREGPPGFARKGAHMGVGLVGKTLGSVGIGNIGAEMFRLAAPFDMNFMACDPYADPSVAAELGVQMVDLDTLCREVGHPGRQLPAERRDPPYRRCAPHRLHEADGLSGEHLARRHGRPEGADGGTAGGADCGRRSRRARS